MKTQPPPFLLEVTSTHGRGTVQLSKDDGSTKLCEWMSLLRLRSEVSGFVAPATTPGDDEATGFVPPVFENDGLAVLVATRSPEELPGEPVGAFCRRLDADELDEIRRAIEMTPWLELPVPRGGQYTAPQIKIKYSSGSCFIEREFNALSHNFIDAIAPLWERLRALRRRLEKHPYAALAVELRAERSCQNDPKQWDLGVKVVNRGTDPVVLTNPLVPNTGPGGQARLELRVGALQSQFESVPHVWNNIPLPPPPIDSAPTLVLKRRGSCEFSVPWVAAAPGRYLLQAKWQDYQGPVERVAGQLPFMPLPERGPSALGCGPYPVRGAAFAERLVDVPAGPEERKR